MTAWLLIILLVTSAGLCGSQQSSPSTSLRTEYSYGLHLFYSGEHYRSITAFQRHLYFHPGDRRADRSRYMIAVNYLAAGRYDQAIEAFHRLRTDLPPGSLRVATDYYTARAWDGSGNHELARRILTELDASDSELADDAVLALGWSYAQERKWADAAASFRMLPLRFPDSELVAVAVLLNQDLGDNDRLRSRSLGLAAILSIAPGGGQLYAGRYADALYSLLFIDTD